MAKKTKKKPRANPRDVVVETPVELRIAVALERIADSLEAFEDAAIYDTDPPFVGISVNHSPDVVGDDVFASSADEDEEDEEEDEDEEER